MNTFDEIDEPIKKRAKIKSSRDNHQVEVEVYDRDPHFILCLKFEDLYNFAVYRGDSILFGQQGQDTRKILGVSVENIVGYLIILAPKCINRKPPSYDFFTMDGVNLRAGTKILGGRNSGFYDDYGIILTAEWVGGDPNKWEDWAYYVIGASNLGSLATQWLSLKQIGSGISEPSFSEEFEIQESEKIDELLKSGEDELTRYLLMKPERLEMLTPNQFEEVVEAIYKSLGFTTERIGSWNQADGGVDIIAISKTTAGTEFRIAIQCKASKNRISARPIRELNGVLDAFKAHQGVVVTTSKFTKSARTEAESHIWKVTTQDRDDLLQRIASIALPRLLDTWDTLF